MIERPTLHEVEERMEALMRIREKWAGRDYARLLDIELYALDVLRTLMRVFDAGDDHQTLLRLIGGRIDAGAGEDADASRPSA